MIDFDPQTINILIAVFKAVVILLGTVIFAALLSFIERPESHPLKL